MKPGRPWSRPHGPSPGQPTLRTPPGLDVLEGRNPVLECLRRARRRVVRIHLDDHARREDKVAEILDLAARSGAPVESVPRPSLDRASVTGVHNGVIAWAEPLPDLTFRDLLDQIECQGEDPFLVLIDEPQYEHNLGAVLRSALGGGVHGVVVPTVRGKGVTAVVQRVAMGAAEAVPVVREGISSCLATLRRRGVRIVGADSDGAPPWSLDLTGPLALVLGGEDKGLTPPLRKRCDALAGIPLAGDLESLNLSVAAGVLIFEKVRQEAGRRGRV
ncbi:MAG: 23S rRNA (guanosine(2251)-2'-O)-methyltransferase RlmB [Deltaproteobacteria bacterium]|nr:23S rRNA (guanosine(2251)-2'-O)-methyltransferase RlmB [Deltaproteobacteria bacterium]